MGDCRSLLEDVRTVQNSDMKRLRYSRECTAIELFTPSLLSLIDKHCEFELVLCWVYHTRQGGGRESSSLKRETEHLCG